MTRLRALREDCDKSQRQIAEALGVTPSAVGGWESGTRQMDYNTLIKIADYFDVSIDYLLGRDFKIQGLSDRELNLISKYRSLVKSKKKFILKVIDMALDDI